MSLCSVFLVLANVSTELDYRVTLLEENGGDGNSSVTELEERVEALEQTTGNQEIRITVAEDNIQGKKTTHT